MVRETVPLIVSLLVISALAARGQQAVSSINQARLFTTQTPAAATAVDPNGTALPQEESIDSGDDSFGAQIIMKSQERPRKFSIFSDVSVSHTSNVDLTPHGGRSDSFLSGRFGGAWRSMLTSQLAADVSFTGSVLRHDRATELDFETMGAGAGLSWAVPHSPGIILFGRYDFTEVLNASSDELLQDHEITAGLQKVFVFGRSHVLAIAMTGTAGFSRPRSQQRDQGAIQAAYHLQITRSVDTDVVYRDAAQFYDDGERVDHNQTLSLSLGVMPSRWLRFAALISVARNDANESAYDYEAFNFGGGIRGEIRF